MTDDPRGWCPLHQMPLASCAWRHDTEREMVIRAARASDEPHPVKRWPKPMGWALESPDETRFISHATGEVLAAILAEVAHLESIEGTGEAIFVIGQYENAIVDAALALRKAMRIMAGGAT